MLLALLLFIPTVAKGQEKPDADTLNQVNKMFALEYDKFDNKTLVDSLTAAGVKPTRPEGVGVLFNEFNLKPSYVINGKDLRMNGSIILIFNSVATDWLFLDSRDFKAVVDGESIDLGRPNHSGLVVTRDTALQGERVMCQEMMLVAIPLASYMKLVKAKKVDFRLGEIEFPMNDEISTILKAFIIYLNNHQAK
jgi:hypothetical protein